MARRRSRLSSRRRFSRPEPVAFRGATLRRKRHARTQHHRGRVDEPAAASAAGSARPDRRDQHRPDLAAHPDRPGPGRQSAAWPSCRRAGAGRWAAARRRFRPPVRRRERPRPSLSRGAQRPLRADRRPRARAADRRCRGAAAVELRPAGDAARPADCRRPADPARLCGTRRLGHPCRSGRCRGAPRQSVAPARRGARGASPRAWAASGPTP